MPISTYQISKVFHSTTAPENTQFIWCDTSNADSYILKKYNAETSQWEPCGQTKLQYYTESEGHVTINTNSAGELNLITGPSELRLAMTDGLPSVSMGVFSGDDISFGVSASNGSVNVTAPNGLSINGSDAKVTDIVTALPDNNGDTDLPTAKAVKDALDTKQDALQTYTESVTGEGADAVATANIGYEAYTQSINIGLGGTNHRTVNISTNGSPDNDLIHIGSADTGVTLTLNTRGDLKGTGISKAINSDSTDAQLPTAKAVYEGLNSKEPRLDYYKEAISNIPEIPGANMGVVDIGGDDYSFLVNIGGVNSVTSTVNINTQTDSSIGSNQTVIGNDIASQLSLNVSSLTGSTIVKSLTSVATNEQIVTAKAVYDAVALKQNITDQSLTTESKTIPGAINELKTATDSMVVVSTDNAINVAPTTAQTGVLIASSKTNGGNVIITPKITNTGACYLSTSSTYSNLNPIYPDPTNNKYTYPNLGTVYLFVDNAGDSADIVIENFAG